MSDVAQTRRWRVLVTPRWIAWHLFVVVAIFAMMFLGIWQFRRAEAGNSLSWAYTFEWPVFSVFAVVFWVKTIKDELNPRAPEDEPEDEMWLPPGASAPPPWSLEAGPPDAGAQAAGSAEAGTPAAKGRDAAGGGDPASEAELAEYNAYLSRLSREVRSTHGKWHRSR